MRIKAETKEVSLRKLRETVIRAGVGSIAAALLTSICFGLHIDLASAIPLYMLLVVVQSMTGDFRSAVIVSLLSAGCLDFFFTQPLFSLYMSNPLNALALVAFVFTALVITRLVSQERQQAKSSRLQKDYFLPAQNFEIYLSMEKAFSEQYPL